MFSILDASILERNSRGEGPGRGPGLGVSGGVVTDVETIAVEVTGGHGTEKNKNFNNHKHSTT